MESEQMDTDCVDFDEYSRCLRDLSRVNVVTLTHRPMLYWLAKQAKDRPEFSLLDIACGHGDALRKIRGHYPKASLTGIDLNPWATKAATEATDPAAGIAFINDNAFTYIPTQPFDFIISSQFTHHLTDQEVVNFLIWQKKSAGAGWFISDIHRHVIPYYGFPLLARIAFWHHIVREDGQISVSRAFVRSEWETLLRQANISETEATVAWYFPFRLCVGSV